MPLQLLSDLCSVIVMTFWYVFGTDLTFFFETFKLLFFIGIDHDPPCFLCSHDLCLFTSLMFHSSHDPMTKRSHHRIMIFCDFRVQLFYGRITTLILFYFLHNPTTPILPIYVDQRRTYLEKDTTRTRSVVIRKIPTVLRRTLVAPD